MADSRLRVIQSGDGAADEILDVLEQTVEVRVPARPAWRHQLVALALVELLGRIFPRIRLVVDPAAPAAPELPPGAALLRERLENVREHALTPPKQPGEASVTVQVGTGTEPASVNVDGSGWISYVGAAPTRLDAGDSSMVPVGPLVAACRAASQVFQHALAEHLSWTPQFLTSSYASALTYKASSEPLEDPELSHADRLEALLVGAGSIGGAAVYLFARTPSLGGTLDIVDPETLVDHNPDRALLATRVLAEQGAGKARVAADALAHLSELKATPHRKRLKDLVAERPRERTLPLVLSAVDSVGSRREIQDSLPLDVLDAACGPSEVSVSGHRTDDGPCIYCLHVEGVLAAETIRKRLLARATGFNERQVIELLIRGVKLAPPHLRAIEQHRGLAPGRLERFEGETLETLYREELLYGEARVTTASGGEGAVAAPFTTALAGFLLAGEALKAGAGTDYEPYRLTPRGGVAIQYRESPWASPADAFLENPHRWPTHECLCRNGRRLKLIRARYGLD